MASWDSMLNGALNGLTGVVKAAIIFFVFAGILFDTPVDALGGIMGFVDTFLNGGLTGLLVLVVFLWGALKKLEGENTNEKCDKTNQ